MPKGRGIYFDEDTGETKGERRDEDGRGDDATEGEDTPDVGEIGQEPPD